ncbi:hypothetical protein RvVAR0630_02090 [Agrobacterium vitis]|nr:hypothetical protein RvVAR0630_02090 [Agrobacterium vitis]
MSRHEPSIGLQPYGENENLAHYGPSALPKIPIAQSACAALAINLVCDGQVGGDWLAQARATLIETVILMPWVTHDIVK